MVSEEVWVGWVFFFPKNTTLHSTKENIHPTRPVTVIVAHTTQTLPASTCRYTDESDGSLEAVAPHTVTGASLHQGWEICSMVSETMVSNSVSGVL